MRPRVVFLLLLSLFACRVANASWGRLGNDLVYTADFFRARTGLIVFGQLPNGPVFRLDGDTLTGVFAGAPSEIFIQDSDRAWARALNTIYLATNHWTNWTAVTLTSAGLVGVTSSALFFFSDSLDLSFTTDGIASTLCSGIPRTDQVTSIEYFSSMVLLAISHTNIYRSTNGGASWTRVLTMRNGYTLFADRAHGIIYAGGDTVRKSLDSGRTWTALAPPPELLLTVFSGQVFGAHDCSGVLFITNSYIYRSRDASSAMQDASFENVGSYDPKNSGPILKAWAFDRGSTIYWWDDGRQFGLLKGNIVFSRDGIDGLISDSVNANISITSDTVYDTICAEPQKAFNVTIASSICTPIGIDSIGVIKSAGKIARAIAPVIISGDSTTIHLAYSGIAAGTDSIVLRLWLHSFEWGFKEHSDFSVIAYAISPPAVLASTDSLQFGDVLLLTSKKLSLQITNSGCSPLRIDSLVSSNPSIFTLPSLSFPFHLKRDSTATIVITYSPKTAGASIESIELGTNAGHKFIELGGRVVTDALAAAPPDDQPTHFEVYPNPVSSVLFLRDASMGTNYELVDLLGRIALSGVFDGERITTAALADGMYLLHCGANTVRILIARR